MTHQPLEERDILRFRMISDPQPSPDGGQVAFVLTEQDEKANRQTTSIWIVAADGSSEARALTAGPRDAKPRWSPDGSRLAFLGARERDWAKDLFVLHMGGGEPVRVAQLPRGITDLAWSPDGDRFCLVGGPDYPADPDREPPATPEEARQRYQERVRHIARFKFRMDGQGVLDDEARQLWVCGSGDGADLRMVTEGEFEVIRPRWGPDGRIAFLGNREADHDQSHVVEVYLVDSPGEMPVRVTSYGKAMAGFAISPDGRLATLRTDTDNPYGGSHLRLWIDDWCASRDLDRTSAAVVLADTSPGREPYDPVWTGGRAYFEVSDRGSVHVYRAAPGQPPERVLGGERVVSGFGVGGERMAFISTSPDDPVSLRVTDLDGRHEQVLFDPNPWMRERSLGTLRRFDFEHVGQAIDAT